MKRFYPKSRYYLYTLPGDWGKPQKSHDIRCPGSRFEPTISRLRPLSQPVRLNNNGYIFVSHHNHQHHGKTSLSATTEILPSPCRPSLGSSALQSTSTETLGTGFPVAFSEHSEVPLLLILSPCCLLSPVPLYLHYAFRNLRSISAKASIT